ncbi:ScbA/BarX family gamma-butyrolactone biosynthesis protein [Streptomyces sp. NPDC002004]
MDGGEATLAQVHRARAADAWPVRWARVGQDRFSVTARWPAAHPFFGPVRGGWYDPLLVAETLRQSVALVTHAGYGVPVGHPFLLRTLSYTCVPESLTARERPVEVEVTLDCTEVNRRGASASPQLIDLAVRLDGRLLATGAIDVQVTSPAVYRRLRGADAVPVSAAPLTAAVPAPLVGRTRSEDVLLSATGRERTWRLRVDTGHPTLFQSPKDHIPGMLLLEAARQAAHAAFAPVPFAPFGAEVAFHSYAEFGEPCWIEADPDPESGARTVRVTGRQHDRVVFRATLRDPVARAAGRPAAVSGHRPTGQGAR